MKQFTFLLGFTAIAAFSRAATPTMLDSATDTHDREWCYLAKSTTVIGVPFQPEVTQITFDGAVFTGNAELCFFYGSDDEPLLAREKTFADGWMPIVQYAWSHHGLACDIEYFAASLDGETPDNTVNFVQIRMRNAGPKAAECRLTAALRHTGQDNRLGGTAFSDNWRYEMTDSAVVREGALIYTFAPGASREAVPGVGYQHPFQGNDHKVTTRSECCLTRYRRELQPGETFSVVFKMPRAPATNAAYIRKLGGATYETYRQTTVAYWKKLLTDGAVFEFPERRVQDAQRASLVHLLLATRARDGRQIQTDGLPYPDFFLTSYPQAAMAYLSSGHSEFAAKTLPQAVAQQEPDGLYLDRALAQGRIIPAAHGQILYTAGMTVLFNRDRVLAEQVFPSVKKAIGFIENAMKNDPHGLMPSAWPYDNEMINGHYTSNNLWTLLGLREAIRLARFMGEENEARLWAALEREYEGTLLKAIAASAKPDGYVPPGLYSYLTGPQARPGFAEYQTHCDWENMLLAYPTETLSPTDPRVRGTVDHVRNSYAEGVMTYRHGMHLHQYITANMVEQYLAMGDSYTALKDFYHVLLHCGSTHEGFENLVIPWTDRSVEPGCPPPHAWASAKLYFLIRNLVLMEYGGKCGLEPGQRELRLFHCLSPAWVLPGESLAVNNAPTEFGPVSAKLAVTATGAELKMTARFHSPPAAYRFRVPYFKELVRFSSDAREQRRDADWICLSPEATRLSLEWRDKPGAHRNTYQDLLTAYRSANRFAGPDTNGWPIIEAGRAFLLDGEERQEPRPLSFTLVRQAFQHEYQRRAQEFVSKGGKLVRVSAPPMLRRASSKAD